ncbi:MAG: hypothetical protein H5T84_02440, partial [Thermoleophilia bacterium]|nr:hypothetical protein [Thermoleophilia bacterium]
LLGPRIGGVNAREVAWSVGRSIVALIPLSVVAYGVWWGLDHLLGRSLVAQLVSVGLAYVGGGLAYCGAAWLLRMPELRELLAVIRRRREPRATEEAINLGGNG